MLRTSRLLTLALVLGVLSFSISTGQDKTEKKVDPKTEKKVDAKKVDPKKVDPKKVDPKKEDTKVEKKEPTKTGTGPTFEMYTDSAGEFRFRLKDADGLLLASSGKGYKTKDDCKKTIEMIQKEAAKAKIDDQTK